MAYKKARTKKNSPSEKKAATNSSTRRKKASNKMNWRQIAIISIMVIALIGLMLPNLPFGGSKKPRPDVSNLQNMPEPQFEKEGELSFISAATGESIKHIEIEVADDLGQRAQGLMYRKSMEDTQGMLFVFEVSKPQGFYMKNTLIPLDILFVDENFEIGTIYENAEPLNETNLPSRGNAQYVVEVNGGFCKKYGVKIGDKIQFEFQ